VLNMERKFVGELLVDASFEARDATSAMSLLIPAMDIVSNGEARCTCCRKARALHRWLPALERDDASRVAHATAGVLSHRMPTWECWSDVGLIASSTSHPSNTPAISRSEIEIVPLLLAEETNFVEISSGH
jgi:hypothetical protein